MRKKCYLCPLSTLPMSLVNVLPMSLDHTTIIPLWVRNTKWGICVHKVRYLCAQSGVFVASTPTGITFSSLQVRNPLLLTGQLCPIPYIKSTLLLDLSTFLFHELRGAKNHGGQKTIQLRHTACHRTSPCTMTSGMTHYQELAQMRVQGSPLPELDGKPPRIDTKRHNAQQPPLDVVTEQLSARSIKHHLFAINNGMVCYPVLPYADCPRKGEPQCETCQERHKDVGPYHPQ